MKLALALFLNAVTLALVLPWLRREWRAAPRPLRRVLLPALALRLLVGGLKNMHLTEDAYWMHQLGYSMSYLLLHDPALLLQHLLGDSYHLNGWNVDRQGAAHNYLITNNSFFFSKLLVFVNAATLGIGWLSGLYVSLFAFVGGWKLVRALARTFPATPAAAGAVAFLLWPSVVGFGSGISKEALLLGSGSWLLALVVPRLYQEEAPGRPSPARSRRRGGVGMGGLGILLLALLHFKARYFFAAPLLLALAGLAFIRLGQRLGLVRSRVAQAGLLLALLAAAGGVGPVLSPVFTLNKFTSQLIKIYDHHLSTSADKPHFEYPDLRPTGESALRHAPVAVWNCLTRPWLGESRALPYVVGGLENLALLALLALAGWAALRGRAGHLPFALVLALAVHCLLLAFLIGLSTPNLGSMHRYRSGLLPFLILLLLQNDYAAALLRRVGLGNDPGNDLSNGPGPLRQARPAAVSLPT